MDRQTLRALGSGGFDAVAPDQLRTLADWCDDWAIATGDARYSLIAETLGEIEQCWGEQGIPVSLVKRIEKLLRDHLVLALDAPDAMEGAYIASQLRSGILALPWSVRDWEQQGWLRYPEETQTVRG